MSPPGPEFFAESIKVLSTPEDVPMVVARHRKADEDHHDRLAQFGSRFTTLNGDFTWPGTFAFKSALAKAKMDGWYERRDWYDPNWANEEGGTDRANLYDACKVGSVDVARRLLEKGAAVERAGKRGRTPLYAACTWGHVDAARLLLDKGAEVDRVDKNGRTPLHAACCNNQVDAVRLLLDKGAEVDQADKNSRNRCTQCVRPRQRGATVAGQWRGGRQGG